MSNSDPILVSYHESIVRRSNFETLNDYQWLDDNIITFAFEYLQHNSSYSSSENLLVEFLSPPVVQLLKLSDDDFAQSLLSSIDILHKRFVIIPVNNNDQVNVFGGTHWSLLILSVSDQSFYHFDSASSNNDRTAKEIVKKFRRYFSSNIQMIDATCPQQRNGYDCGLYLICVAEEFWKFVHEYFDNEKNLFEQFSIHLQRSIDPKSINERRKQLKILLQTLIDESSKMK